MKTIKLPLNGQEVEATSIEVISASEHWNHYTLEDGTVIRTKHVATEIFHVPSQRDAEGNPVYMVRTAPPIIVLDTPPCRK